MDLNLVLIKGRTVAAPDVVTFPDGVCFMRLLVAVRTECPIARLDVLPVIWWEPMPSVLENPLTKGSSVWVIGSVQRRLLATSDPPRSDVEIVARGVVADPEDVDANPNSEP